MNRVRNLSNKDAYFKKEIVVKLLNKIKQYIIILQNIRANSLEKLENKRLPKRN